MSQRNITDSTSAEPNTGDSQGQARSKVDRRSALTALAAAATAGAFGFSRAAAAQSDPSTWVIQTAKFGVDPMSIDEATAMLEELAAAVEEKEPDVLIYVAHLTQEDPKAVFFYEVYANAEALTNHGQTEHIGKLRAAFGSGVLMRPAEVVRLDRVAGFAR